MRDYGNDFECPIDKNRTIYFVANATRYLRQLLQENEVQLANFLLYVITHCKHLIVYKIMYLDNLRKI